MSSCFIDKSFVNFFFALVPSRVRSVNTYKVFGTSRATLMANFTTESVCVVALRSLGAADSNPVESLKTE